MARKKTPPKLFCLVNLCSREIGRRKGKPILHEGAEPPRVEDYPKDFSRRAGWSFEAVEVVVDHSRVGKPPIYCLDDFQCGRVSKRIAPPTE
jgi:hypothetical protein